MRSVSAICEGMFAAADVLFAAMYLHTGCPFLSADSTLDPHNAPLVQTDIVLPVHGRNKPIALGQVGIRCMHCKDLPSIDRGNHAIAYPNFISGIYNAVQQMYRLHFEVCNKIPDEIRRKVEGLKDSTANRGGRKQYWQDSARRCVFISLLVPLLSNIKPLWEGHFY